MFSWVLFWLITIVWKVWFVMNVLTYTCTFNYSITVKNFVKYLCEVWTYKQIETPSKAFSINTSQGMCVCVCVFECMFPALIFFYPNRVWMSGGRIWGISGTAMILCVFPACVCLARVAICVCVCWGEILASCINRLWTCLPLSLPEDTHVHKLTH